MKNMKNAMALALALCLALCLCACSQPAAPTTEATEADDGKVTYTVKVVDESGKVLAGVAVQLCDEFCTFASTNAEGVAEFKLAEGNYHASVMAMPEGYTHVSDKVEFDFEEGSTEMTITLKAAK